MNLMAKITNPEFLEWQVQQVMWFNSDQLIAEEEILIAAISHSKKENPFAGEELQIMAISNCDSAPKQWQTFSMQFES